MKVKSLWLVTVAPQSLRVLVMTNLIGQLLIVKDIHCLKVRLSYRSSDVTGQYLPDDVNVTLRTGNNTAWHMHLRHVKYKSCDIPLYTVQVSEDGEHIRKRMGVKIRENTGFYRDQSQLSLVKITRTNDVMDKTAVLKLKGQIFLTGSLHYLTPHTRDSRIATSGSVTSDSDIYTLELIKTPPFHNKYDAVVHKSFGTSLPFPDTPGNFSAGRPVRHASGTYRIDIAVVVDYAGYQQFYQLDRRWADQSLLEYTAFVMAEVDEIYQELRTTAFKIRVCLIRVIVMKRAGSSPFTEQHVEPGSTNLLNAKTSLNAFIDYIVGDGKAIIGKHDHVMLFSGYDLAEVVNGSLDQNIAGVAHMSSLCLTTGRSSSVVEILTENYAPITAAHELAHNTILGANVFIRWPPLIMLCSLGAAHDGEGNDCRHEDRYIMAESNSQETPETTLNPWKFSLCSIEYFKIYLTNAIKTPTVRDCLTKPLATDATVPKVANRLTGQEISLDKQCERNFGSGASFCRTKDMVYADLCHSTTCKKHGTTTCVPMPVARGTTCGNGKLCKKGDCVQHKKAPQVDDNCVFGDSTGIVSNNMKCDEYIKFNVSACYNDTVQAYCCDLCKKRYRAVKGCEYGDKIWGCKLEQCNISSNIPRCCRTCNADAESTDNTASNFRRMTTRKPEQPQKPQDGNSITQKNDNTIVVPVTRKHTQPSPKHTEGKTDVFQYLIYILPLIINLGPIILIFACFRRSRRISLAPARRADEDVYDEDDSDHEDENDKEVEVEEEAPGAEFPITEDCATKDLEFDSKSF